MGMKKNLADKKKKMKKINHDLGQFATTYFKTYLVFYCKKKNT